jgi:hypothetical protein
MSGSPVYVRGRLAGALSSGWAFNREPVFGVTPIGDMLEVLDRAANDSSGPSSGPSGSDPGGARTEPRFRELGWDGPESGAAPEPLAAPAEGAGPAAATALTPLPLPLLCGGLHPLASALVARALSPFGLAAVPGGVARDAGPAAQDLQPGAAVAVDVLRGDLQFSAIGTLTYRDGDRVLLFGHPFFQAGDVRMPLSTAEIVTIIPSQQSSFKLGVRGREVGAVLQDRRTAVAGRLGIRAHMLPLRVEVSGLGPEPQVYRFETIEDRGLAPIVIGVASVNSLLESGGAGANQTLHWTLRLDRAGADPLVLSDEVASDAPANELAAAVSAPLRFLFANPFERLALDSVRVQIRAEAGRHAWTLRGARLLDAAVRPGSRVRVECELERWRGPRETRRITMDVPEELPDGRYTVWLGGGAELARYEAARLPGRYRVISLDDAWRRLAETRSSNALYTAVFARAPEVTADGRDYPELPVSALSIMASDQAAADRTRRGDLAWVDQRRVPFDGTVRGEMTVTLVVDSRAPAGAP